MPAQHIRAKLKFRDDLSWELEKKLMHKFGFTLYGRKMKDYIIVQKFKPMRTLLIADAAGQLQLPGMVKQELDRRINNIMGMFQDNITHRAVLRNRFHNVCQTMPPEQAAYVQQWVDDNLPVLENA